MALRDEIVAANEGYAGSFKKGDLPAPPGRRFAVVTCMDARLDPAKFLGLDEGDAHVIRNAGGLVTDDATPIPVREPVPESERMPAARTSSPARANESAPPSSFRTVHVRVSINDRPAGVSRNCPLPFASV